MSVAYLVRGIASRYSIWRPFPRLFSRLGHVTEVVKNLPNFVEYMRRREDRGRQGDLQGQSVVEICPICVLSLAFVIPNATGPTGLQFCASISIQIYSDSLAAGVYHLTKQGHDSGDHHMKRGNRASRR